MVFTVLAWLPGFPSFSGFFCIYSKHIYMQESCFYSQAFQGFYPNSPGQTQQPQQSQVIRALWISLNVWNISISNISQHYLFATRLAILYSTKRLSCLYVCMCWEVGFILYFVQFERRFFSLPFPYPPTTTCSHVWWSVRLFYCAILLFFAHVQEKTPNLATREVQES